LDEALNAADSEKTTDGERVREGVKRSDRERVTEAENFAVAGHERDRPKFGDLLNFCESVGDFEAVNASDAVAWSDSEKTTDMVIVSEGTKRWESGNSDEIVNFVVGGNESDGAKVRVGGNSPEFAKDFEFENSTVAGAVSELVKTIESKSVGEAMKRNVPGKSSEIGKLPVDRNELDITKSGETLNGFES
jgi:hypothetical protein